MPKYKMVISDDCSSSLVLWDDCRSSYLKNNTMFNSKISVDKTKLIVVPNIESRRKDLLIPV